MIFHYSFLLFTEVRLKNGSDLERQFLLLELDYPTKVTVTTGLNENIKVFFKTAFEYLEDAFRKLEAFQTEKWKQMLKLNTCWNLNWVSARYDWIVYSLHSLEQGK